MKNRDKTEYEMIIPIIRTEAAPISRVLEEANKKADFPVPVTNLKAYAALGVLHATQTGESALQEARRLMFHEMQIRAHREHQHALKV